MSRLLASSLAGLLATVVVTCACPEKRAPVHQRTLFFRGDVVAHIEERIEDEGQGKRIHRRVRLQPSGEIVDVTAVVDAFGFVQEAHYRRGDKRAVDVVAGVMTADGSSEARQVLQRPAHVVIIDLQRHVQPPGGETPVTLVDLASAAHMPGRVGRQGAAVVLSDDGGGAISRCNVEGLCTGPGAFFEGGAHDAPPSLDVAPLEPTLVAKGRPRALRLVGVNEVTNTFSLDGPGQRPGPRGAGGAIVEYADARDTSVTPAAAADREPAPFIESNDAAVKEFAAGARGEALADAARIAEAVFPLVDAGAVDAPPSARAMLKGGGDCDGAAALVVASLRALGHSARPVVGYKRVDTRFVPHAWAEVYTPTGWLLVDATVPRVGGTEIADEYLKLFHGLGSALTMGRVLGRLRVEPAPSIGASAGASAGATVGPRERP